MQLVTVAESVNVPPAATEDLSEEAESESTQLLGFAHTDWMSFPFWTVAVDERVEVMVWLPEPVAFTWNVWVLVWPEAIV